MPCFFGALGAAEGTRFWHRGAAPTPLVPQQLLLPPALPPAMRCVKFCTYQIQSFLTFNIY